MPFRFIIDPLWPPRPQWPGWAAVPKQLFATLLNANHWLLWVIRTGVDLQSVCPPRAKASMGLGGQYPLLLQPRLACGFFSVLYTVAGSIVATTSNATNRAASSFKGHRACPAGGGLQVRATHWASAAPSSLRECRPGGRRRDTATSNPCGTNRLRTRATVAVPQSSAWAMR